jgi:c-di-GMP-binding flagellar brake protein YcgR
MSSDGPNRRQFARISVSLRVRFRVVRGDEADALREELLDAPSVWAPEGESLLLKLATGSGSGSEGLLARAVLDVSRQIGRLSHHVLAASGPTAVGDLLQLSGGGCLLSTRSTVPEGSQLDLRIADDDLEAPPIRFLAEVVRGQRPPDGRVPLRFASMHPSDQERLIRFLHALQRRQLRKASRVPV